MTFISVFQAHSIYSFGLTIKEPVLLRGKPYKHSSILHIAPFFVREVGLPTGLQIKICMHPFSNISLVY